MRAILSVILSLLVLSSFSQTTEERELDLKTLLSGEQTGNPMTKVSELLAVDKFNSTAIELKLCFYSRSNQKDSIKLFFDNLINSNKGSAIPYLLRAEFSRYESLNENEKLSYLKKAYILDSTNVQVNYSLAETYYELFNKDQTSNWRKTEQSNVYARKCISFINKGCTIDNHFRETLKYPFVQLSNYLGDTTNLKTYNEYIDKTAYFPASLFIDMPSGWETNYMMNVMCRLKNSRLNWYSKHLKAMKEPVLQDSELSDVFRFTWLRSFHHPIVIGLKKDKNKVSLYWKVCDGQGGYEPGKMTINQTKQLSMAEWKDISEKVDLINFWNLPSTEKNNSGLDGAQWILEGRKQGKYHVVDRWEGIEITGICMALLKLTDLGIEKNEIY